MSQSSGDCSPDYFDACEDSPNQRVGSNKLQGVATPKGKSIFFLTPTEKKIYEDYNVHWRYLKNLIFVHPRHRYEDYVEEEALPPVVIHSNPPQQKAVKAATTPRSAGRFKFVHSHP